jgi:hypothetical protein
MTPGVRSRALGFHADVTIAQDGEQFVLHTADQDWLVAWHLPNVPPEGKNHGALGLCFTPDGHVVLVTENGKDWNLPAGRPELVVIWCVTMYSELVY